MTTYYTTDDIEREMNRTASHWWDADTMQFFRTRVGAQVYQGPGGVYFVTSEKPPHGPRMFSVRQYDPKRKKIDTTGDFCSMTRGVAHRWANSLAQTAVDKAEVPA